MLAVCYINPPSLSSLPRPWSLPPPSRSRPRSPPLSTPPPSGGQTGRKGRRRKERAGGGRKGPATEGEGRRRKERAGGGGRRPQARCCASPIRPRQQQLGVRLKARCCASRPRPRCPASPRRDLGNRTSVPANRGQLLAGTPTAIPLVNRPRQHLPLGRRPGIQHLRPQVHTIPANRRGRSCCCIVRAETAGRVSRWITVPANSCPEQSSRPVG